MSDCMLVSFSWTVGHKNKKKTVYSAETHSSNGFMSSKARRLWTHAGHEQFGTRWNMHCLIKASTWNKPALRVHKLAAWKYISARCYIKQYQPCYANIWRGLYVRLPSPAVVAFKYFYKIQPPCTLLDLCLQSPRGKITKINHKSVAAPPLDKVNFF